MKRFVLLLFFIIYRVSIIFGQSNHVCHDYLKDSVLQNLISSYQNKLGIKESENNTVRYYDLFLQDYYSDTLALITIGQKDLFHWPGNKEMLRKYPILQTQLGSSVVRIYPDIGFSISFIREFFNAECLNTDSLLNIDVPIHIYDSPEYTFRIKNQRNIEFVQIGAIHGPYPNEPDEPTIYGTRHSWSEKNVKESIKYLKSSRYKSDTIQYHFSVISDSLRAYEIREYFQLDSLYAPDSKTWEKAMAISQFVSTNVPHIYLEITAFHPRRINAVDLWIHNRDVYCGLNSRLHAILNNELLQAAGLTARYMTCMPKETDNPDIDRHVVNEVWLPELNKWAFIDSDLGGHYFTNLQGEPLSLLEIREKLVSGEQMLMYEGFSQTPSEPDYYYALVAKYAYWFYCWETLRFSQEDYTDVAIKNTETNRIIEIVPLGFIPSTENHIQRVITTDASRFWSSTNEFSF